MTLQRVLDLRPDWECVKSHWPNAAYSQFIPAAGIRWHVQIAGQGAPLLLLHGTAASTHSFADLLPLLAAHYTVIAPDLPGHGFTSAPAPARLSLPDMAAAVGELLTALQFNPTIALGHSAGAAILAYGSIHQLLQPHLLISLNGALLPLRGMQGKVFSPLAQLLARRGLFARIISYDAGRRGSIERLLASTGSQLSPAGVARYRLLVQSPGHVAAALNMMANWDLQLLQRELPQLRCRLLQLAAANDMTVPPATAQRVQRLLPAADIITLDQLGHLAHEEDAARVAAIVLAAAAQ